MDLCRWFIGGKHHGKGKMTFASGDSYEGDWKDGFRHGKGIMVLASGGRYEGEWATGAYEGHGVYTFSSGAHYDGMWKNGVKHGAGTYYCQADSDIPRCEGTYENGQEEGIFMEIYPNGLKKAITYQKGTKMKEQMLPAQSSLSPRSKKGKKGNTSLSKGPKKNKKKENKKSSQS